jgi:ribosomal protein L35AE/L33A
MIEIPNREREVASGIKCCLSSYRKSNNNSLTHILEKLIVDRKREAIIYIPNAVIPRILTVDFNCYYVDGYYAIL